MQKVLFPLCIVIGLSMAAPARAAVFVVTDEGNVERNVLGESTIAESVKKVAEDVALTAVNGVKEIALTEIENKTHVKLKIPPSNEEQVLPGSVTELVLIETARQSSDITVHKEESGFSISQSSVRALTNLPITIQPEDGAIFLGTQSGALPLTTLPVEAVVTVVRAHIIDVLSPEGVITIIQDGNTLQYEIVGERTVNFFNLGSATVPIKSVIDVATGEVVSVDQPKWLQIFGFLLS